MVNRRVPWYSPVQRPDGRWYRPLKRPKATLLENNGEVDAVLVLRCDYYENAELMALHEAWTYNASFRLSWPVFGWWRESLRNGEPYWVEDPKRGVPGYLFKLELV